MSTSLKTSRVRRSVAQLLTLAGVAALLVVLPEPTLASVPEMVVDTVEPTVEAVPAPESPAAAEVVEELEAHAAIGPLVDLPAGPLVLDGDPVPTAPAELDGERQVSGAEPVDEFRMIGVQYEGAEGEPALVRVQSNGTWGEWFPIETGSHQPDPVTGEPMAQGSTDPIWVDQAQAYEVDLPAEAAEVEVHLVREGDSQITIEDGTDQAEGAAAGVPGMRFRSQWGAAPYRGSPDYGTHIGRAIVHHTVNGNGYSAAQVPSMLRGVQSYHQSSNGWSDIGYNFVIDRFGTIWEGRQGGVDRPVIGAHAFNNNTNTVGIAALGEFTSTGPGSGMLAAYQRLIGWKLSLSGTTPNGNTVLGHRNVGQTSCPGNALYNQLPTIRSGALSQYNAQHPTPSFASKGFRVSGTYRPTAGDFNGDNRDDLFWYGPGAAADTAWYGNANRTFSGVGQNVTGDYARQASGDFNGDGRDDVLLYNPGPAKDVVLFGNANRTFGVRVYQIGGDHIPLVGDFNRDGREDIFWYTAGPAQDLIWYGRADATFLGRQATVNGAFVPTAGDFDGDGHADILWYGSGTARDFIWYGTTSSTFFSKAVNIGGSGYRPIAGDFNRNGRADVIFYRPGTGADAMWISYANRTFRSSTTRINGTYTPMQGDFDGDRIGDVFWYGPGLVADSLWYGR